MLGFLDEPVQDLRYGLRWLRRSPGFALVVVLTLAGGIGINTAMFSVVNAVLLQPLPYPAADRLAWIANWDRGCMTDCFGSRADFEIWKREAKSFEGMAAFGNLDLAMSRGVGQSSTAERVAFVSGEFFSLVGAQADLGRLPRPDETDTLVLSAALFERQFAGDPNVIGRKVKIDGHLFEITGVLRKDFRFLFPQELNTGDEIRDIDAYVPLPAGHETPGDAMHPPPALGPGPAWVRVFGRLRPGATIEQAGAEITVIHERLRREYPSVFRKPVIRVSGLADRITGGSRLALLVLLGAVGFVLLIACVNVANLLLARASARRKEIAVRAALGAGKGRVMRQFLTESLLLAAAGGAAGLLAAQGGIAALAHLGAAVVPRAADASIDGRVLGFTILATVLTGLLFGLAPASTLWREDLEQVLREDGKASSAAGRPQGIRAVLVAGEIAIAVVLLTGAGLMLRSFWRMNTYPSGFHPEQVAVMRISLGSGNYFRNWARQDVYLRELTGRLEGLPGVEAVGLDCGTMHQAVKMQGRNDEPAVAALRAVSKGYFAAIGVPLTRGQWPTAEDEFDTVMVNQSMAWRVGQGGEGVTGQELQGAFFRGAVKGVVADFKDQKLDAEPAPQVYISYRKAPTVGTVRVFVRVRENLGGALPAIREAANRVDPDVAIQRIQTLEELLAESIAPRRFQMYLMTGFAATALVLAVMGIYGLIAFVVTQRTREIGIRMALGARRQDIVAMIAGHGMRITAAGLLAGIAGSLVLSQTMASLIYDVSARDPLTLTSVGVTLGLSALAAGCRPAFRAATMDPVRALRED